MQSGLNDDAPRGARTLRVLIPWFALPVLAGPLVMLLIEQDAGILVGLDHASFRIVCLAMLAGLFEVWAAGTLAGAVASAIAFWRRGRVGRRRLRKRLPPRTS